MFEALSFFASFIITMILTKERHSIPFLVVLPVFGFVLFGLFGAIGTVAAILARLAG